MKEHHKRRNSTEEFYKNYLREIEKRMETKSERANTIVEQKKQERNYIILRFVTYIYAIMSYKHNFRRSSELEEKSMKVIHLKTEIEKEKERCNKKNLNLKVNSIIQAKEKVANELTVKIGKRNDQKKKKYRKNKQKGNL